MKKRYAVSQSRNASSLKAYTEGFNRYIIRIKPVLEQELAISKLICYTKVNYFCSV